MNFRKCQREIAHARLQGAAYEARFTTTVRVLAILSCAVLLSGCMGWMPGRQTYWDAQVREMCAKDGGVTVFEKVRVTKAEVDLLGRVGGNIGIPAKELANPKAPVYEELQITLLRDSNPRVARSVMTVIRRADQAVVARAVMYARSGGDIPSPSHPTSFSCPDFQTIVADLQPMFIVEAISQ